MVCGTRRCFRWSIIYKKGVFNDFLQFGWISGEVFVAVSDNFGEKTFLVTKIVAVCPISLSLKPNDVKIAFPFILDPQNNFLTDFPEKKMFGGEKTQKLSL